ncbi:S-layer homology domain-containing protein [Salibacterium sp. K-3]
MKTRITACILTGGLIAGPVTASAETEFQDISDGFWAQDAVEYMVEEEIMTGYENGDFRPNDPVQRQHMAVMLSRAFELEASGELPEEAGIPEDHPYAGAISAVYEKGWMTGSAEGFRPGETVNRAQMAEMIKEAFDLEEGQAVFADVDREYWAWSGISAVVQAGFADGYEDGTFRPGEELTRAQMAVILHEAFKKEENAADDQEDDVPEEPVNAPEEETEESDTVENIMTEFSLHGVALEDSEAALREEKGEPERVLPSIYGFDWYTYHDEYEDFVMFGVQEERVVAFFSYGESFEAPMDIALGMDPETVVDHMNTFIEESGLSPEVNFGIEQGTDGDAPELIDFTVYHEDIDTSMEYREDIAEDSSRVAAIEESMALQQFELVNAARTMHDIEPLEWNEEAAEVAEAHSDDMAANDYFAHNSQDGRTPMDRFEDADIDGYMFGGENLATGQRDARRAHRALMNSPGHRENILRTSVQALGVGVTYDAGAPYYAESYAREDY